MKILRAAEDYLEAMLMMQKKLSKPVWSEKIAVGSGQHWMCIAEMIGSATAIEQRPKPQKSLMTASFFCLLWEAVCCMYPPPF